MSLRTLFVPYRVKEKWVSFENFMYLIFVYITIMIGFGLIYTLFQMNGIPVYNDGQTPSLTYDFFILYTLASILAV